MASDLKKRLESLRRESISRDAQRMRERSERDDEWARVMKLRDQVILSSAMRPASCADYVKWLVAYMDTGGNPTHWYDHDLPTYHWWVADNDFVLPPLYGASSMSIVVGPTVLTHEAPGHTDLFLRHPPIVHTGIVPVYRDVLEMID